MLCLDDWAEEAETTNGLSAIKVYAGNWVYVVDIMSNNKLLRECLPDALLYISLSSIAMIL